MTTTTDTRKRYRVHRDGASKSHPWALTVRRSTGHVSTVEHFKTKPEAESYAQRVFK